MTKSLEERKAEIVQEFMAIMKQWDAQVEVHNPGPDDIARLGFLRLKIDGYILALQRIENEEKMGASHERS